MIDKKRKKAVIFGTESFAEVVDYYLTMDSKYDIVAFTDESKKEEFKGRPVVPFDNVEKFYSPEEFELFVAIGARKMNNLRKQFMDATKEKGFKLLSYICSKSVYWGDKTSIEENVFVFENNTVQPFVSIGRGTILWSGNHIGHHSQIGTHCFITSHVVVSGHCKIGSQTFLGVNSTISDGIVVGEKNLIGPNSFIQKNTPNNAVYLSEPTKKFNKDSGVFFK